MTDGGLRAMFVVSRNLISTVRGVIALAVVATLFIGLFLGSPVGRIVCAVLLVGVGVVGYYLWKSGTLFSLLQGESENKEEAYSQSPEGNMKKLLFDDFQSSGGGKYVVKEIEEQESQVVPSTKTAKPVAIATKEEKLPEFKVGDFFDLESDIFRSETEPRSEFHFLLDKLLLAMKDVVFAYTVAFFWANREKQQMVLEAKATDSGAFMSGKRFDMERDILSQVARSGKPQVLGRVNPVSEKELIRYYESPEHIKSLIVVPVFYLTAANEQLPVGVFVADSKAEDAFGLETLHLLSKFTKLASALVKSYTDKYDLLLDSELLTSVRRLQDRAKSDATESTILNSLADEAIRLMNWDCLAVTMYSEEKQGWIVQKVVNRSAKPYIMPEQQIDFQASIIGEAIRSNAVRHIDELGSVDQPRFYADENIERKGSFLCIPISSLNRCYGALSVENGSKFSFSGNETETLYRLVENAASLLEVIYMNDLVRDYVIVDHVTGAHTRKHFLKALEDEVTRADDFEQELSMISLAIDSSEKQIERHGREGYDFILAQIANIVRSFIRPYDIVGREDADQIGVLLINTTASDAYLCAEGMRKQIASHVITYGSKSFSVTVSAGVCGLTNGMKKDELLAGTNQVLGKAKEGGGNLVRIY